MLYQYLGKFVILFQNIERAIIELIVLMAKSDDEAIEILINELDYSKQIKTTDVLFSHYVDIRIIGVRVTLIKDGDEFNSKVHHLNKKNSYKQTVSAIMAPTK